MRNKLTICAIAALVAVASGCSSYQQAMRTDTAINMPEENIRSKIIETAQRGRWSVCDLDDHSMRLLKENNKWSIGLIAEYHNNGYKLSVDEKTTSLVNKYGDVHKKVNKVLQKMDSAIRLTNARSHEGVNKYEIEKCTNRSATRAKRGSFFLQDRTQSNVVWAEGAKPIPETAKFYHIVTGEDEVPEHLVDSMRRRMDQVLTKLGVADGSKTSYRVEVLLKNFNDTGLDGPVMFAGKRGQLMRMKADIKDPAGNLICTVNAAADVPTGGFGDISRASNRITKNLADAFSAHMSDEIIEE